MNHKLSRSLAVASVSALGLAWCPSMAYGDQYSVHSHLQGYSGGAFGQHITESTEVYRDDVPKFTTALGPLTQVDIRFDFDGTAQAQLQHTDSNGNLVQNLSGYYAYTTGVTASLVAGVYGPYKTLSAGSTQSGSTTDGYLRFTDHYGGTLGYSTVDVAELAAFSDTNLDPWYFDVMVNSTFAAALDGYTIDNPFDFYAVSAITDVDLTVTYTYGVVPEPSPVLLGLPLLLLGAYRQRRRRPAYWGR